MRRILIIKPSSIGDVLHTFPAVALMRRALDGDLRISWVVNENLRGVVELCPGIDRIVPFPRASMWRPSCICAFLRELRSEKYDVALDFQGLLKSGLIAHFSGAPLRAGFAHAREGSPWFYNRKVRIPNMHSHAADKNLLLVKEVFGIEDDIAPSQVPIVTAGGGRDGNRVAVCFSSRWKSKNWPLGFLASVMDELAASRPGISFLLIGSKDDAEAGDELAELVKKAKVANLAGKTDFKGLAKLLAEASVLFTVDSGPMHLAAACGTPCVALFGATDPVLTGPYGAPGFHSVILSKCAKSPCFRRQCPLEADCSAGVSPEEAAQAMASYLKE